MAIYGCKSKDLFGFLAIEAPQNLFCGEGNTAFLRISDTKACGLSRTP